MPERATDMSVTGIARQVGYDDPAYFSHLFTRRIGVAPTTFRTQAVAELREGPRSTV